MCNNNIRIFRDQRNPEVLITEDQIKREYGEHIADGSLDPAERNFQQYLHCCMEAQGGTLSEVHPEDQTQMSYRFVIYETLSLRVDVEANSYEEAQKEVERLYDAGEFNLDHNCFAGVEFYPCCSCCESDFADPDDLREVDGGTPDARILCDQCVAAMEDRGELTRCECCEDLFSPSRLKINPENNLQEICPLCGEVWCE